MRNTSKRCNFNQNCCHTKNETSSEEFGYTEKTSKTRYKERDLSNSSEHSDTNAACAHKSRSRRGVEINADLCDLVKTMKAACEELTRQLKPSSGCREPIRCREPLPCRRSRSCAIKNVKFTFKDVEESFEKFRGDDNQNVDEWLDEFIQQANMFNWDDDEKLIYAKRLLWGPAKLFVKYDLRPKTWWQLTLGLRREFNEEIDTRAIHLKLGKAKKRNSESFNEFLYRMMNIAAPAKLKEKTIIEYIVDAVAESTECKLFLSSATSIAELKEKLKVFENCGRNATFKSRSDAKGAEAMECFNCGSGQHKTHHCPDRDKGPLCFKCKSFGHRRDECRGEKPIHPKSMNTITAAGDRNKSNEEKSECEETDAEEKLWEWTKGQDKALKNFVYGYRC